MTDDSHSSRYQPWFDLESGTYALERSRTLLRALVSAWPRRSRSMLVLNAGSGRVLETLWEAGFDVTAQESDPAWLALARERLGKRAEFVLSAPDHLPFDDCFFDYAVAAGALEFWDDPEAVLTELGRLACGGVVLVFPNAWSLFGLECRLRKTDPLCAAARPLLQNPRALFRLLRRVYDRPKLAWISALPGPSLTWGAGAPWRLLNAFTPPLPLGAFVGVRIDFGPQYAGTPMVLRNSTPVPTAK